MPEKLKVGIIGMGAIGEIHGDAYLATGKAEVASICDADKAVVEKQGERLAVKSRFADYRDLLATDVHAVSVCVPNHLHREVTVASFEAGKHVLCEKPMAMSTAEAGEMIAAHEQSGKVGQMAMVWRHKAGPRVIREYVEAGLLGEIYHMRAVMVRRRGIPGLGGWFTTKARSGGGPMIDLGVHWFDLCMWLSDQWTPTSVSAATYQKFGTPMEDYTYVGMWAGPPKYHGTFDVEDYSTGLVRFGGKCTMSFEIAWAANTDGQSFIELLGDRGGVHFDGTKLTVYTEHNGRLADITPQFDGKVNGFEAQKDRFVDACRGLIPSPATLEQGRTVMKLLDAIYASGEAGREVPIA